jgi:MFS transporter, DHA1 family, tetracycline resistance protein
MGSLISQAAGPESQGTVQGGSQALQSVALITGPLWAGWLYAHLGPGSPFATAGIWIVAAMAAISLAAPALMRHAGADDAPSAAS